MNNEKQELLRKFFERDATDVAIGLLGKTLCHRLPSGEVVRLRILETEAYTLEDGDLCYGSEGKIETHKSKVFYSVGLLCDYYDMLMISCKSESRPDNVLIRSAELIDMFENRIAVEKPIKLRDAFWKEDKLKESDLLLFDNESVWIEISDMSQPPHCFHKRINVVSDKKWHFCLQEE